MRTKQLIGSMLTAISMLCIGCGDVGSDTQELSQNAEANTKRNVLLVGNSAAGTISFIDAVTFENLGSLNVIPDHDSLMTAWRWNPIRMIAYKIANDKQKLRHFEPSDGLRYVDDVFTSPDGTTLYVSRSNIGDFVAFDLMSAEHKMLWRTEIPGFHADHATLSPDGSQVVVSATTADKALVLDAKTGATIGTFATGHYPHQNDYSANGQRIYNGSIGDVGLPSFLSFLKGARRLTVVDATTLAVVRTYDFAQGIRPTVITPDEKIMYAQLSWLNGVIKYDLEAGKVLQTYEQPLTEFAKANYPTRDDYPHDSAHHGLALSGDGTKLCDAGTIDNTVSILRAATMTEEKTVDVGLIPYWATTSGDGNYCFVSVSGDNVISVIDYRTGEQVVRIPTGKFPQRNRLGQVNERALAWLSTAPG